MPQVKWIFPPASPFRDAIAEDPQRRLDLTFFSLAGDDPEHRENIFHRLEVIPAIAHDVNDADDAPILEFAQAGADVGAGDPERLGDLIGRERFLGKKEKSVDLSDGAINAPAGPHFSPMKDKFLGDRREVCHDHQSFLSKQKLEK